MKNKFAVILVIILLMSSISTIATAATTQKVPVKVIEVVRGTVEVNQLLNGVIEPLQNISVSSKVGGFIKDIKVEIGQMVKAGQTLVIFEQDQILIQIKQAEAAVEMAKANLDILLKGASEEDKKSVEVAVAQAQISYDAALKNLEFANAMFDDRNMQLQQFNAAKAQADNALLQHKMALERAHQAEIAYEQASIDYTRMRELYNNQVITLKQFEGVKFQLDNAEVNYKSSCIALEQAILALNSANESYRIAEEIYSNRRTAEQQVEGAKTQLELSEISMQLAENNLHKVLKGASAEQVRVSKASVKQAEVALEMARLQLENCTIKSPIAGVVAQINADPAEMTGPGVPVLIIIGMEKVYVKADITGDLLQSVRIGDIAKVNIHGLKEEREGQLRLISPMADPRTQAFPIKVLLDNPDYTIRPGMFVDLKLTIHQSTNALLIPIEAVQNLDNKPYVYVVKDGKAFKRMIQVGLINDKQVEVLTGLAAGEKVAIRGQYSLNDGDQVEVIKG